ncbi:MAG: DUF1624 domain-containing protein [Chitinophagaceae bacterium]|nr:DUF1624 domain-containing protein [Chitinophagaceae bacterium]
MEYITAVPVKLETAALTKPRHRIRSIDILRGVIMILMALDHTRDFFHDVALQWQPTDLTKTNGILFFTRWITHYCAPVFIFLAGISAFLYGTKTSSVQLRTFLLSRGIWLIVAELFIVGLTWTFDPLYRSFFLQVIWAIGCSMVILSLLIRLPLAINLLIGTFFVFSKDLLQTFPAPTREPIKTVLNMLVNGEFQPIAINDHSTVTVMYAILPWTGVMILGYCIGRLYGERISAQKRRNVLLGIGISLTSLFVVLRFINQFGDPSPWITQESKLFTLISFFNVSKYPPSAIYLCMTLGPAFIFLSLIERVRNNMTQWLSVFGKTPFFFYILHFVMIHALCTILFFMEGRSWAEALDMKAMMKFYFRPADFGYNLGIVYAIWFFVIVALYQPCKWFAAFKRKNTWWGWKYL